MFKGLDYKKKNRLLAAGAALFVLLAWNLAFSSTWGLYKSCKENESKLEQLSGGPHELSMLKKQLAGMDQVLGRNFSSDRDNREALLRIVSEYCNRTKVVLREFPSTHIKTEQEYRVETNYFTVEGNFENLLGLVYYLEQKEVVGRVASVEFNTINDRRTKKTSLNVTVYVQNIKKV